MTHAILPEKIHPWLRHFIQDCHRWGFDQIHAFDIADHNRRVLPNHRLAPLHGGGLHPLGLIIGHSRALWPAFLDALARDETLLTQPDPLDAYATEKLEGALADCPLPHRCVYSHHMPAKVSFQALAVGAGLAALGPCHLNIHPQLGPWFGMRALLILGDDALKAPFTPPAQQPSPCETCPAPCKAPFDAAMAGGLEVRSRWQTWVKIRQACPEGAAFAYGADQLEYHYSARKGHLQACVAAHKARKTSKN